MSSVVSSLSTTLSLTEAQTNLVLISMASALFQLVVYIHLIKKSSWSMAVFLYLFIVFMSNVLFYKIFMN
jgi:hypothetical protein